jgi:DnaK suppressor protein
MDNDRARQLIQAKRAEVQASLADTVTAGQQDRESETDTGDSGDPAASLTAEGVDDAIAAGLRERLDALDRAEKRLDEGNYGLSIRSGLPIPDERLEVDPSAELTVEEAEARR